MSALSRPTTTDRWFMPLLVFDAIAGLAMVAVMWAGLLYAGDAVNLAGVEQVAQRIFYFHIGSKYRRASGLSWVGGWQHRLSGKPGAWCGTAGRRRVLKLARLFGILVLLSRCNLGQTCLEYVLDLGSPPYDLNDPPF